MRHAHRFPLLTVFVLAWAAGVQAQDSVVVVRIDPGAEAISRAVESAIGGQLEVIPDPGYLAEARRQGLEPASDQGLGTLVPQIGARVALVPRALSAHSLELEFRDGQSGRSTGVVQVPLQNGVLGPFGQKVLLNETRKRLGIAAGAAGGDGDDGDALDEGDPSADGMEDGTGDGTALAATLGAGIGVGTRTVEWPVDGASEVVDLGAFPALELHLAIGIVLSDSFRIGPVFAYQSSFQHEVTEQHLGGPGRTMGIRAHRFDGLLVPQLSLGESVQLALGVGYGVRDLSPDVHHLLVPSYSIAGPMFRPGLHIAFSDAFAITLEPEVQLLMQVSEDLRDRGVGDGGLSFGGIVSAAIGIGDGFALWLSYREVHGSLDADGGTATDVERFVMVRFGREL